MTNCSWERGQSSLLPDHDATGRGRWPAIAREGSVQSSVSRKHRPRSAGAERIRHVSDDADSQANERPRHAAGSERRHSKESSTHRRARAAVAPAKRAGHGGGALAGRGVSSDLGRARLAALHKAR